MLMCVRTWEGWGEEDIGRKERSPIIKLCANTMRHIHLPLASTAASNWQCLVQVSFGKEGGGVFGVKGAVPVVGERENWVVTINFALGMHVDGRGVCPRWRSFSFRPGFWVLA